jgi:Spy/CpxP family protein refolding chaperone
MSARPRRLWLIAGIASAVLNVFLVGFIAGRQAFGPGGCGARGFGRGEHRGEFQKYVSSEEWARLRAQLAEVRKARKDVREALEREPFDRARLEASLSALRQHSADVQQDMHRMLLDDASKLTPEQRRRLAGARFLRPALGPGS